MSSVDQRGCPISGATPSALDAYERALAAFQSWHKGAGVHLARALEEAPAFVMTHVLRAYLFLGSRDPCRVREARPTLASAVGLPANRFERLHLAAIEAALADDYDGAKALLGEILRLQPRDVLALQIAHAFDYLTGDVERMRDRVAAVLPAWSSDLPGYHAVLAMHAFSLGERGEYALAEQTARAALALNPYDARAHHAMAHVFEMTERPAEGVRWMNEHVAYWSVDTTVAMHCWWHLALFHLAQGQIGQAMVLYDRNLRAGGSTEIPDLIDAAALLWRVQLLGADTATRSAEIATAWTAHIDDRFCSFSDLHAMLAFVGARDWDNARRLELALAQSQSLATRHGATTSAIGLPVCRALIAYGRNNDTLAIALLASLPAMAHRIGGSHAQRDVLNLTLLSAVERVRRSAKRVPRTSWSRVARWNNVSALAEISRPLAPLASFPTNVP